MNGIIKLVTDNGWNLNDHSPYAMLGLNLKFAKQLSDRVVLLPSFNSQITLSSLAPVFYKSYIGGFQKTNYFGNYLPFAGLKRMEISADNVAYACLDLRVRMWEKIYTTFISNIGVYNDQMQLIMAVSSCLEEVFQWHMTVLSDPLNSFSVLRILIISLLLTFPGSTLDIISRILKIFNCLSEEKWLNIRISKVCGKIIDAI